MIHGLDKAFKSDQIAVMLHENQYPDEMIAAFQTISESQLYPPLLAMEYHRPALKHIWLLLTESAKSQTYPIFMELAKALYPKIKSQIVSIQNPDDIHDICNQVDRIYYDQEQKMRYANTDITADITGGPATATAGIVLACVHGDRQMEYLGRKSMQLQTVDVTVRHIPHLIDELISRLEKVRIE